MTHSLVLRSEEQSIVTLTLNREESANALSTSLLGELQDHLDELVHSSARVVILTGSGSKAFCAGADLKERRGMDEAQVLRAVARIRGVVNAVAMLPMPVIAAINGVALGGGTELALAADLRIAVQSARFGLTETSLAIIPGAGGTQRLSRLIGTARAKELIYTARRIDAQRAWELGMVNDVVPDVQLHTTTVELAVEISKNGPIALRQAKYAIDHGLDVDLATGLAIEAKAYEVIIPTADRLEGLQAFAEKRMPRYEGR